jgi:uncharacterized protein YbaR (Trm112 family)
MKMTRDFGVKLVCPACRVEVAHVPEAYLCRSPECRRSYPIVDGIPKFLIDDARVLSPDEWRTTLRHNADAPASR